jgi:hypothetical protein
VIIAAAACGNTSAIQMNAHSFSPRATTCIDAL